MMCARVRNLPTVLCASALFLLLFITIGTGTLAPIISARIYACEQTSSWHQFRPVRSSDSCCRSALIFSWMVWCKQTRRLSILGEQRVASNELHGMTFPGYTICAAVGQISECLNLEVRPHERALTPSFLSKTRPSIVVPTGATVVGLLTSAYLSVTPVLRDRCVDLWQRGWRHSAYCHRAARRVQVGGDSSSLSCRTITHYRQSR